jgi:hypothetical protein
MSQCAVCIHTPKRTFVARPRSPRNRAALVREAAQLDGWAYATVRSAPGVRTVIESINGPALGSTHMDLDVYNEPALTPVGFRG